MFFLSYAFADKWRPIVNKTTKKTKKHQKQRTDKPLKAISKGK